MTPVRRGLILAVANAVIYSVSPAAIQASYADGANAAFVLLILNLVRAICMGGFCLLTRRRLFESRAAIRQAVIGGLFQLLSMVFILIAYQSLPGPLVITILFTHTLMLLLFMVWRREIRLNIAILATTLTALVGLSLALDVWHAPVKAGLIGIGCSFAAALATFIRFYTYGRQIETRHPIVVGAETFCCLLPMLIPVFLVQWPHAPVSTAGWSWTVLYCSTSTLGFFGTLYGIGLLGSFQWSLFAKLEPIFTAFFAALLISQILKPGQYLGMVVVLASLAAYQIMDRRARLAAQRLEKA